MSEPDDLAANAVEIDPEAADLENDGRLVGVPPENAEAIEPEDAGCRDDSPAFQGGASE
ncbi:hypothetical protein [Streptomonospora arabica]|uniref:Uncharacterized protein n=1 Tax=Streptomonospora arabica TaxID=412417 RepID=A0ABV9SSL0_9ACTN